MFEFVRWGYASKASKTHIHPVFPRIPDSDYALCGIRLPDSWQRTVVPGFRPADADMCSRCMKRYEALVAHILEAPCSKP